MRYLQPFAASLLLAAAQPDLLPAEPHLVVHERFDETAPAALPGWATDAAPSFQRPTVSRTHAFSPPSSMGIAGGTSSTRALGLLEGRIQVEVWVKPGGAGSDQFVGLSSPGAIPVVSIGRTAAGEWVHGPDRTPFFDDAGRGHLLTIQLDTDLGEYGFCLDADSDGQIGPEDVCTDGVPVPAARGRPVDAFFAASDGHGPDGELLVDDLTVSVAVHPSDPVGPATVVLRAAQNYPNPFNAETAIEYDIASPGHVSLAVYDMAGQRVRTLLSRFHDSGSYGVRWDGRDQSGMAVASGVYFYRLVAARSVVTRRMVLLR